jgi:hypothetical protein
MTSYKYQPLKTKHTPGPWEKDISGKNIQIYNSIGTLVVDKIARRERVSNESDDGKFSIIEISNAKLIEAAPVLLKSLYELTEYFKFMGKDPQFHEYTEALAAIKKATDAN